MLAYRRHMGERNYLVEGVSTSGKTAVCEELRRRGHDAVHGDRELAYRGDPATGAPVAVGGHATHLWDVGKVRALVADRRSAATFLCGGSRNHAAFIHLFDAVFVLTVDRSTLLQRLDERPDDEFGARPDERALVERLHLSGEDVPEGIAIDATAPLEQVVDDILARTLPHG